jgi:hypothetical protein
MPKGKKMGNPLFFWNCPRSFWNVMGNHFPWVLFAGVPLLLAGWVPLKYMPLIKCTFLRWTGYPCPFCGFSRSFWALAEGNWHWAFSNCPLSTMAYVSVFAVFIWNSFAVLFGIELKRGPWLRLGSRRKRWIVVGIISLLLLLNWIYRLQNGLR